MKRFKQRKTLNISGFTDSMADYEKICQILLAIGEKWLKNKPLSIWKWEKESECWYGSLKDKPLKELRNIFFNELKKTLSGYDITVAQADAVIGHLSFIHRYGRKKWFKEAEKQMSPSSFSKWPKEGSKLLKK